MKRPALLPVVVLLLTFGGAAPLALAADGAGDGSSRSIRGQVVSVDSSGERLTVRCRGGIEYQLQLGPDTGAGQFKVGDPVRARINAAAGQGAAHRVQWLENRETRQRYGAGSDPAAGPGNGPGPGRRQGAAAASAGGRPAAGRGGGPHRSHSSCAARGSGRR